MNRSFLAVLVLLAVGLSSGRAAMGGEVDAFLVGQGCAIGPGTIALAAEAGVGAAAIEDLLAEADGSSETIRTGDWIVLPSSLCTLRVPDVASRVRMDDPEVKSVTSGIDEFAEYGDYGCFLAGEGLARRLEMTRGWEADTANREYLRFLAENLGNGNLAFYKDTPLSTPAGIQVLTGDCADVPNIDAIRASQALRDRFFDRLIRQDAAQVACETEDFPSLEFADRVARETKGKNTNAWLFAELRFISMGAGWYEGLSATEKGRPRPPLCHFEAS